MLSVTRVSICTTEAFTSYSFRSRHSLWGHSPGLEQLAILTEGAAHRLLHCSGSHSGSVCLTHLPPADIQTLTGPAGPLLLGLPRRGEPEELAQVVVPYNLLTNLTGQSL